ncbi:ABC transporter ATP-binding protein [Patescibacteria group bacterium]|nr:ABC transporter ATP-binding protein [Patescibacteria group bacterium]
MWREIFHFLAPSFRGTFFSYATSIFFIVLTAVSQVVEPVLYGVIIDRLIAAVDLVAAAKDIFLILGIWAAAVLLSGLAKELGQWYSWRGAYLVYQHFADYTLRNVLYWDPDRYARQSLGALAKRLDTVWTATWTLAGRTLTDVVPSFIGFFVFTGVGFWLDWRLALATLACVPFLATLTLFAYRQADEKQEHLNEAWEGTARRLFEIISNIVPIKSFGREDAIAHSYAKETIQVTGGQRDLNITWTTLDVASGVIRLFGRVGVFLLGLVFIIQGTLSVGGLVTFLGMMSFMLAPFDYLLADVMRRASEVKSAFGRIVPDLTAQNLIEDPKKPVKVKRLKGSVRFSGVSYRYPNNKGYTLSDIHLFVPAGTSLAIVGPSGGGKSTLTKFVNRFLDPTVGTVALDDHDVRSYRVQDLRRQVGVVHQETVLFHDTIFANVQFARPSATKLQVIAACKKAQAHEFIMQLPDQYNTMVGERGAKLSGGERQRLAIARAILADQPVLVLDESTSALDSETELKLQMALKTVMEKRTTIIIAHRLSTIYMADQIAVIEKGKLVELGTHDELLREGGLYEKLWRLQSGGYFPN